MGKLLKYVGLALGALILLLIVATVSFVLLFDPNDFRDKIADGVERATGREFVIEGDLDVSLFPWLAIDVGRTRLGNAPGFGDDPFLSFEKARLSVRLLPLIFRREVAIGTAELDSLVLNLTIKRDGTSNWQDLAERGERADEVPAGAEAAKPVRLDVAGVNVTNANVVYNNAQLGERYTLSNANLVTGAVAAGEPVRLRGDFGFRIQPSETTGTVDIDTVAAFEPDDGIIRLEDMTIGGTIDGDVPKSFRFEAPAITLDTEERTADVGALELELLDVDVRANVEPFSYADSPQPVATISIAAFSPRSLMQNLNIDVPPTADPNALGKLIIDAKAVVSDRDIALSNLKLTIDDTRMTGSASVPRSSKGTYRIDLAADEIDLNRYMEPAVEEGSTGRGEEVPVEIPAELIRAVNVRGNLTVKRATLGRMTFTNAQLGINSANGQLRLHPLSAELFEGSYQGDVRINAAGSVPVLSVNEQIKDVRLGALAQAMFEKKNITGTINGTFTLEGRGNDMGAIQKTLKGNMSFVLADGAWEGTDVWYQIRRARALFKKQAPPEPTLPARTRFSEVTATGVVTDGKLRNDDFFAELPFMRLTGRGTVDFPTATIDYSLSGRVLEKPEFPTEASDELLKEMTRAVIPFRITGPLAAPKFAIDFGALIKERAKEEIRDRVLDKLLGGDKKEPPPEAQEGEQPAEEEPKDPEDILKDKLKDLLKR